jgi:flagellar basal body rod protein FlgB
MAFLELVEANSMSKLKWVVYGVLLAMAGSVLAAQITLDEDYMQVMEDRQKSLTNNIALRNVPGANEDLKELGEMFAEVEAYYTQKGNAADAVGWAKTSGDYAVAITNYVAAADFDNASVTSVKMAKTCKECHSVYKKDKDKK